MCALSWHYVARLGALIGLVLTACALPSAEPSEEEQRLQTQLRSEGRAVNVAMAELESELLGALRWMVAQDGISEAIAAGDTVRVGELLSPQLALTGVEMAEVFVRGGTSLTSLRGASAGGVVGQRDAGQLAATPAVRNVLDGVTDAFGDKFADLVELSGEAAVYAVAPVRTGDRVVGAIAVGTSAERLLGRLRRSTRADLNLYARDGRLLATTLQRPAVTEGLTLKQAVDALNSHVWVSRRVPTGRGDRLGTELVGALEIRSLPAAPLGLVGRDESAERR